MWTDAAGGPERRLATARRQVEDAHAWLHSGEVEHPLAERRGETRLDTVVPSPKLLRTENLSICHGTMSVVHPVCARVYRGGLGPTGSDVGVGSTASPRRCARSSPIRNSEPQA